MPVEAQVSAFPASRRSIEESRVPRESFPDPVASLEYSPSSRHHASHSFSESDLTAEGLRFRCIIKAAFNTIRVNQVLSADRPSKLRKWRYAERNASCTASSASSLFGRMEYAIAKNLLRDATNISSKTSFLSTSSRVSTSLLA